MREIGYSRNMIQEMLVIRGYNETNKTIFSW
jgi:hypothetical protein